jgi:hypothetical protein
MKTSKVNSEVSSNGVGMKSKKLAKSKENLVTAKPSTPTISAGSIRAKDKPRTVKEVEAPKPARKFNFGALVSVQGWEKYPELTTSNARVAGHEWGADNLRHFGRDAQWFYYLRPADSNVGAAGCWVPENKLGQIT